MSLRIELSNLTFGVSVIPAATSLLRVASAALNPFSPTSFLYYIGVYYASGSATTPLIGSAGRIIG